MLSAPPQKAFKNNRNKTKPNPPGRRRDRKFETCHELIRITEDARYCFEISGEIGHGHGDRHWDSREVGSESYNQKQTPEAFNGAREIRIQHRERDAKAHEKVRDFPDVGKVTLASHK
jgi:hypothetical protein